jgi:Photosynthesis system II assembly factor YCF48
MALGDKGRDKAAADLLRRTLVSSGTGAGAELHPEPEILAAYSERALDADETAHCELHFSQCPRCRDQLTRMVRAATPTRALARDARARRFHWVWPWAWFVLTPVTMALLIAAVFIARRPASKSAAEQSLMAMQTPDQPTMPSTIPQPAPEDRVQKTQETLPATLAPPPSASPSRAFAGATQRQSSDFASTPPSIKQEPDNVLPQEDKKLRRPQMTVTLPGGSCYAPVDGSRVPPAWAECDAGTTVTGPAAPKPKSSGQSGDAVGIRAQAETVTVESAAPPVTTAPAPQTLTNAQTADTVSPASGAAGAAGAPKREQPAFVAGVAHNTLATNEMVVVEAPFDRGARTLVRSPDPQVLWRISSGRYVERSVNGGATWRVQWTNADASVVAGSAPSADTCWLVGRGGIVLRTTDANKWQTITPPADADFASVAAVDASSATVTTTDGHQFKTSDGGKHWTVAP